jgi:hypothetical protein
MKIRHLTRITLLSVALGLGISTTAQAHDDNYVARPGARTHCPAHHIWRDGHFDWHHGHDHQFHHKPLKRTTCHSRGRDYGHHRVDDDSYRDTNRWNSRLASGRTSYDRGMRYNWRD